MRKSAKCVLATLLMFCFAGNVKAAECSYDKQVELNNQAATVKATYEETEIDTGESTYYVDPETDAIDPNRMVTVKKRAFNIKILNLTKDIYVKVKNGDGSVNNTYYSENAINGVVNVNTVLADKVRTYEIVVYASGGGCSGKTLRTITLVIPKYNTYSELQICKDNSDFDYCQEYITTENVSTEEFQTGIKKFEDDRKVEEKKENKTFLEKLKDFYEDNKTVILVTGSGVIVLGVTTAAIIVVKRRSRLI